MRKRPQKIMSVDEEIISYEHVIGSSVRVVIAYGTTDDNGVFIPDEGQNYEVRYFHGNEYDEVMAEDAASGKPSNQFRKDDLWKHIDKDRNKKRPQ